MKTAWYDNSTLDEVGIFYQSSFKGTRYFKDLPRQGHIRLCFGRYSRAKPWPLTFHKDLELHYMKQGGSSYYVGGKIYYIRKKELFIVKPNEVHGGLAVKPDESMEKATLVFPLSWIGLNSKEAGGLPRQMALMEDEAARFDLLCGQMADEAERKGPCYEELIRTKCAEFYYLVRRRSCRPELQIASNPVVKQLKDYIDRHFARPLKISELSRLFGYSGEHLTRQFRAATGSTLKHYILQRRAIEARLLIQTCHNLKLNAIAEQVGFNDYSLFSRAFKYFLGVMPVTCRQLDKKTTTRHKEVHFSGTKSLSVNY